MSIRRSNAPVACIATGLRISMPPLQSFYRSFLLALVPSALILLIFFHFKSGGSRRPAPAVRSDWVSPEIHDPYAARSLKKFWAGTLSSQGQIALDPLHSSELFSKLFPGYPDMMRTDRSLWADYFSRDFDVKVMSEALSENSLYGNTIYYPWIGCLDVFRRYGADIVIFGASDVAQSLPPDLFSTLVGQAKLSGLKNPRILTCLGAAGVPEAFGDMAREMLESIEKVGRPKWIVYGYSATSAYVDSVFYESAALSKVISMNSYRRNVALGSLSHWNHPVLFPWTWNDLIRLGQVPSHLPFVLATKKRDPAANFGRWSVLPQMISRDYLREEGSLRLLLSVEPFKNPLLLGNTLDSCDWIQESKTRLDQAMQSFHRLAPHVLLYLSPSTGDDLAVTPSCYASSVSSMLQGEKTDGVTVSVDPPGAYGLTYADFVFGDSVEGPLWIDAIHPNIYGARKVTRKIVDRMAEN
jgi:hypothetical protein